MKGSRKNPEPQELTNWIALGDDNDNWTPKFPIDDASVKRVMVECLWREQRGLCVYCGKKLLIEDRVAKDGRFVNMKNSHIEHFRPLSKRPELGVEYRNLFLSCNGNGESDEGVASTCGHRKSDWFEEDLSINPDYPKCTRRFLFNLDGTVEAKDPRDSAAKRMLDVLNLNNSELVKERRDLLLDVTEHGLSSLWNDKTGTAENYAHVAFEKFGEVLP